MDIHRKTPCCIILNQITNHHTRLHHSKKLCCMRVFKGIGAPDCYSSKSASHQHEGGACVIIRRVERIPVGLLPSRARFRLTQQANFQIKKLHLQPVEKDSHLQGCYLLRPRGAGAYFSCFFSSKLGLPFRVRGFWGRLSRLHVARWLMSAGTVYRRFLKKLLRLTQPGQKIREIASERSAKPDKGKKLRIGFSGFDHTEIRHFHIDKPSQIRLGELEFFSFGCNIPTQYDQVILIGVIHGQIKE